MSKVKAYTQLFLAFAIIGGFGCIVWLAADTFGLWDVYTAQQQTRQAEAQAHKLEAEADALRERQAMLMTGALTFASVKDSLLVSVTYIGGGLALFAMFILVIVLLLERGRNNGQKDA